MKEGIAMISSSSRSRGLWVALFVVLVGTAGSGVLAQDDGFGPPIPPRIVGPKIAIEEPNFHWGKVLHGEVVEHVYRVYNQGSATLRISNVKPG